jgi:hypothetical protein
VRSTAQGFTSSQALAGAAGQKAGEMKRVTVLNPDTVITAFDSASASAAEVKRLDVTPKPIVMALTTNDYHERV